MGEVGAPWLAPQQVSSLVPERSRASSCRLSSMKVSAAQSWAISASRTRTAFIRRRERTLSRTRSGRYRAHPTPAEPATGAARPRPCRQNIHGWRERIGSAGSIPGRRPRGPKPHRRGRRQGWSRYDLRPNQPPWFSDEAIWPKSPDRRSLESKRPAAGTGRFGRGRRSPGVALALLWKNFGRKKKGGPEARVFQMKVAEGVGFEPTPPFRGGRISNPLHSTTLPTLRGGPNMARPSSGGPPLSQRGRAHPAPAQPICPR